MQMNGFIAQLKIEIQETYFQSEFAIAYLHRPSSSPVAIEMKATLKLGGEDSSNIIYKNRSSTSKI